MSDTQWIASFFLLYMTTGLAVVLWFTPVAHKGRKMPAAKIRKR